MPLLAPLGDYTVLAVAVVLFIWNRLPVGVAAIAVALALYATGVGESRTRLPVSTMVACAVLTASISVNGAVAALIPMVMILAVRLGRPPSQLLVGRVGG